MKKRIIGAFLSMGLVCSMHGQTVSNFENVLQGGDTTWNGSDVSGGFVNGAAFFLNDYNIQWGSWSGFSVSKTTDTVTGTWSNQYSSISGNGANRSPSYGVVYSDATAMFTHSLSGDSIYGLSVNNSTYAYKTILNGDNFTEKFGGATGNDPDFFSITFYGYNADFELTDSVEFFLADYRDANNSNDYIVKNWTWVNLKSLGNIRYLGIEFSSSDVGQFGINTPTYACVDSLVYKNSSSDFMPIAAYMVESLPFNSSPKNYNVVEFAINPGNTVDSLSATMITQPTNGTMSVLSDSIVSYEPNIGFNGVDTVWVLLTNQAGLTDTGLIQITVNDAPVAMVDTITHGSDGVVTIDILDNDLDEVKSDLRVSLLDTAKNGNASIVSKQLEYISNTGFEGADTVSYLICDLYGACDTGWVYITIKNATGIEAYVNSKASVYPNPTKNQVQVKGLTKTIISVDLISITGEQIPVEIVENKIDLSEFDSGIYFLSISMETETQMVKVIKQ